MPAARSRRDAEGRAPRPKTRSDAYVGLLAVSLIALTAAMVFAYIDYSQFPEGKPKPVQIAPRGGGGPAPMGGPVMNPPGAPPAGIQGAPPPGMPGQPAPPGPQPQPKQ